MDRRFVGNGEKFGFRLLPKDERNTNYRVVRNKRIFIRKLIYLSLRVGSHGRQKACEDKSGQPRICDRSPGRPDVIKRTGTVTDPWERRTKIVIPPRRQRHTHRNLRSRTKESYRDKVNSPSC